MRCFLHIDAGETIIRDDEGADFPDIETAVAEGRQSARELIVEELRNGRPIPLDWLVLIAPENGEVTTIAFSALTDSKSERQLAQRSFHSKVGDATRHFNKSTASHAAIRDSVSSIRASLRELTELSKSFSDT